ncbi:pyruvoyl-dependent arginine decarboxylase [Candidatus Kuenenbacteria bacterium]|nr:pyruvoyl-dependent arginine decarboxylase [Candidatus Kuenenbacteria bacterium]
MQTTLNLPLIPSEVFFTRGWGNGRSKDISRRLALRAAGIGDYNIVNVDDAILPPKCKVISRFAGLSKLRRGEFIFCVLSCSSDSEPNRLVSSAVGWAWTPDTEQDGFVSRCALNGQTGIKTGDEAEDLAATMLASNLGIEFDPEKAWREREETYQAAGQDIRTSRLFQSRRCGPDKNIWTTVVTAAVFLM